MKKVREFLSAAGSKAEFLLRFAITLACAFVLPGFLLLMLYRLVAPLFGEEPVGHIIGLLGGAVTLAAIVAIWGGVTVAGFWLWEKSAWFRRFVAFVIAATLLVGVITTCSGHRDVSCMPSRYVEC